MRLESCLPYTVRLIDSTGTPTYYGAAPASRAAAVAGRRGEEVTPRNGIRTLLCQGWEVIHLPPFREDVCLLVEAGVCMLGPSMGRWDLVCVDPETLVPWPETGGLVAYRGLITYDGDRISWEVA